MSDLKRIALELLEKWKKRIEYKFEMENTAMPAYLVREFAAYKARIEAAEPEIEAITVMGPILGRLAGTGKTLGQDKLGSLCSKCGHTHLCKLEMPPEANGRLYEKARSAAFSGFPSPEPDPTDLGASDDRPLGPNSPLYRKTT